MANYLIIGASSGIGEKVAEKLAQTGHLVFGIYCNHPALTTSENIQYHAINVLDETWSFDFLPEDLAGIIYCAGTIPS